jgi:hypothetical protein
MSTFNQWSAYFRLTKRLHWGGDLPVEGFERYAATHNPLVGAVEGIVREQLMAGPRAVEGIPVTLDGRVATTGGTGHYRFINVAEGAHEIRLAMQELPADYEGGTEVEAHVKVEPRAVARADLNVVRLTSLTGKIAAPEGVDLEALVIRLFPTDRYTTPDPDGNFAFYNLREQDYELAVDDRTIPEHCVLLSVARLPVAVRLDSSPPIAVFEIGIRKVEKPVRMMIDQTIDLPEKVRGGGDTGTRQRGGSGGSKLR